MHWINNDKEEVQDNIEPGPSFINQTPYIIMCMCDKQRIQWESHLKQIGRQFFHCFLLVALSLFVLVTTYCLATLQRLSSAKRGWKIKWMNFKLTILERQWTKLVEFNMYGFCHWWCKVSLFYVDNLGTCNTLFLLHSQ